MQSDGISVWSFVQRTTIDARETTNLPNDMRYSYMNIYHKEMPYTSEYLQMAFRVYIFITLWIK